MKIVHSTDEYFLMYYLSYIVYSIIFAHPYFQNPMSEDNLIPIFELLIMQNNFRNKSLFPLPSSIHESILYT